MNKFTLKMEQPDYNRVVELKFEEEFLQDVLMQIDLFLRGCGYVPTGDHLEYVDNFDESLPESSISIHIDDKIAPRWEHE